MVEVNKIDKRGDYVYDISLDGTVVNALGMNICSNTDGFNFSYPSDDKMRYTKEHPYIGKGLGRNVKGGKEYTGVDADLAEFEDTYFGTVPNGGIKKWGIDIDEWIKSSYNFKRKNYLDLMPDGSIKKVGNTFKSKKMPEYISKFMNKAFELILKRGGNGYDFIEYYYSYLDKIYNFQIPLRDIAAKGKIKKTLDEYKSDLKVLTKAGRPKSRQAWYELAIQNNLRVSNGDTIYYVNTGKAKAESDVKKITHYYIGQGSDKKEITKDINREWSKFRKANKGTTVKKLDWMKGAFKGYYYEEEIIMNCQIVPQDVIDSEKDLLCSDLEDKGVYIEYNCQKYISAFNKRISSFLACFDKSIRDEILVNDPKDRKYFTKEQCELVNSQPMNASDQDNYDVLMRMEDREVEFWKRNGITPPFTEEIGQGKWSDIVNEYDGRKKREQEMGIDKEKEALGKAISGMTSLDCDKFIDDGIVPNDVLKICDVDPITLNLMSKTYPDIPIGSLQDISNYIVDLRNKPTDIEDMEIEQDPQ